MDYLRSLTEQERQAKMIGCGTCCILGLKLILFDSLSCWYTAPRYIAINILIALQINCNTYMHACMHQIKNLATGPWHVLNSLTSFVYVRWQCNLLELWKGSVALKKNLWVPYENYYNPSWCIRAPTILLSVQVWPHKHTVNYLIRHERKNYSRAGEGACSRLLLQRELLLQWLRGELRPATEACPVWMVTGCITQWCQELLVKWLRVELRPVTSSPPRRTLHA